MFSLRGRKVWSGGEVRAKRGECKEGKLVHKVRRPKSREVERWVLICLNRVPSGLILGTNKAMERKKVKKKERERGADGQTRGKEGKFTQKAAEKEFGGQM